MVRVIAMAPDRGPNSFFPPTLRILALSSCLLPHGLKMVAPTPASGLCSGQKEEQGILCPEGEPVFG